MILLFGGTTEGRSAVDTLEAAGSPFFYSTKTGEQRVQLTHGLSVEGAMDEESMLRFCRQRNIRLMVDAAHPFASQLHLTVVRTAKTLGILQSDMNAYTLSVILKSHGSMTTVRFPATSTACWLQRECRAFPG